ncbi:NAD(P)H-binding protein [Chitinophaga oryziterrae]|uniref:NAD(P)H-binding protein n=1 Tax=Chitinophaga oryziterrae TaxID=1031224 RepID=A0A6N8JC39_9BACT|nr:NAD(P)H-binding protein [Chitinophaga oryziterrae]MVT41819.1 NAD(P)H-binding protein [Chitinophaga oryziterrae]
MKITITGSLGNISRGITEILTAKGHQVTVVTQSPERVKAIEDLNATAAVGSVEDIDFLVNAFKGADAVYTMIPPNNNPDFMTSVSRNYAKAIEQAGVRYVVNLSSVGSPLAGQGPLKEYHNLEESLNGINVLHLRPGMFYTNFFGAIEMIKHQHIIGNNFDGTVDMFMTHPHDIAAVAADALDTLSFTGVNIHYLVSDKKNGNEVAQILADVIGQPISWVPFTDEQLLQGLMQNGFSKELAENYFVAMGVAIREGLLSTHYQQNKYPVSGKITFKDFATDFARAF